MTLLHARAHVWTMVATMMLSLATGFTATTPFNVLSRNDASDSATAPRLRAAADYYIEESATKQSALDVQVFRGFSSSAGEHRSEQRQLGNDISEQEAVDLLMEKYDESGRYVAYRVPGHEPQTYFVALYNYNTEISREDAFFRQNGIVGVVSAQLRRRLPLIVGTEPAPTAMWDSVTLPSPHVFVANMSVDTIMRRKGVASELLDAIGKYATDWSDHIGEKVPLVLTVDNDNGGAIRLYEKVGFQYMGKNDDSGTMILWP